jgi:integrase
MRSGNYRRTVWRPAVTELASRYSHLAHLRIHDLRHTAASLAISAGGSIMAIQRMLGHKDASMTLDRYGHLYDDDLIDLATKLEAKFLAA